MTWDAIKGHWTKVDASLRDRFSELTPDDCREIGGERESLVQKLQLKYGMTHEQAVVEADEWCRGITVTS